MKKILFLLLLIISINCARTKAQHFIPPLHSGIYIDSVIDNWWFPFTAYCDSVGMNHCSFQVTPNLFSIVSGVEIKFVTTYLPTSPDSAYTLQSGTLHLGDTLSFTSSNNYYNIISSGPGYVGFDIVIFGTPIQAFEYYPCSFHVIGTTPICGIGYLFEENSSDSCMVDNLIGINELNATLKFNLTPNPASEYFEINSKEYLRHKYIFKLISLLGKEIYKEILPVNFISTRIGINNLQTEIYFWKITDEFGFEANGKIIISSRN